MQYCRINIQYENTRGTPCPEYIKLEGEQHPSHPRLWWIEVTDPTPEIKNWYEKLPKKLAAPEVAAATRELETFIGVKDPTSDEDWKRCGVDIYFHEPAGGTFVNWPDPDLGKGW